MLFMAKKVTFFLSQNLGLGNNVCIFAMKGYLRRLDITIQ